MKGIQELGQSEIGNARLAGVVQEDVRGFEVAVQHALAVRVVDGLGDLLDQYACLARGQWAIAHQLGQSLALDVIHREEGIALVLAHFVDGDDVGMLQARGGFGLRAKARYFRGAGEFARQNHFQRHDAIKP